MRTIFAFSIAVGVYFCCKWCGLTYARLGGAVLLAACLIYSFLAWRSKDPAKRGEYRFTAMMFAVFIVMAIVGYSSRAIEERLDNLIHLQSPAVQATEGGESSKAGKENITKEP